MIKKLIDKNLDHIYCNNLQLLQDLFAMVNLDIYMTSNNKSFDKDNLERLLNDYMQFLDQYFLYLNCEFFNQVFSLKTAHHRLLASGYFYKQLGRAHEKYAAHSAYTKSLLTQHAVDRINTYSQLVYGDVH